MGRPLTILEAEWVLYRQGADGAPVLDQRVWDKRCVERLRLSSEVIERETWPTGEVNPRAHHLGQRHGIEVDNIWNVDGVAPYDYTLELGQKYVLVILWKEPGHVWYRRTYYGVTDKSVTLDQAVEPLPPGQGIQWRAEYMVHEGGFSVVPPFEPAGLPLRVRWAGTDGAFWLFAYDEETREFHEVTAGLSSGRAEIANSGDFELEIQGERALWVESGVLTCHMIVEAPGVAASLDVTRVEFWKGEQRLASVSKEGVLRVFSLTEEDFGVVPSGFQFVGGGVVKAVLNDTGLQAEAIAEV